MSSRRAAAIAAAAAWFDAGALLRRIATPGRVPDRKPGSGPRCSAGELPDRGHRPQRRALRLRMVDLAQSGARRAAAAVRRTPRGRCAPDGADLRPRRRRRRLRRSNGATDARRGSCRSPTASGMAAARPTTRASTRSIWPHSPGSSRCRGRLGFNAKLLLEMGEEIGSPGLRLTCERHADALRADVLIASDGPRLARRLADDFPGLARRVQFRS